MRFNAIGPALPRRRSVSFEGLSRLTTTQQSFIGSVAIFLAAFLFRLWLLNTAGGFLADQTVRKTQLEARVAEVRVLETQLDQYQQVASEYAKVRDSGLTAARVLVGLGNAWPDPTKERVSLECLTPSDAGDSYDALAVAGGYDGYVHAIEGVSAGNFAVVPTAQDLHENRVVFHLKVTPSDVSSPSPSPSATPVNQMSTAMSSPWRVKP